MKFFDKFKQSIWPVLAVAFIWILFAPLEICANNASEVPYSVHALLPTLLIVFLCASLVGVLVMVLLPRKVFSSALCLLFGFMLASYVQATFLNGQLTELDGSQQAWMSDTGFIVLNAIIWVVLLVLPFILSRLLQSNWKLVVTLGSVVLLAMQGSGLTLTVLSSPQSTSTTYYIPAPEAYTLGAEENVVVFVVDTFSNTMVQAALEEDPSTLNPFQDFTLYENCSQVYQATVPAFASLVTGQHVDMTQPSRSEMFKIAWTNEYTSSFYQNMKDLGYSLNIYTRPNFICDGNTGDYVMRYFDNVESSDTKIRLNISSTLKNYFLLSACRNVPYALKMLLPLDLLNLEATYTLSAGENDVTVYREWYFTQEQLSAVRTDEEAEKKMTIFHGYGAHLPNHLDENGEYNKDIETTDGQVARGNLKLLADFIQRMKDLGLYDSATIIITADHGHTQRRDRSPVFMFKAPYTTQDAIVRSNAPIRNNDTLATIAGVLGMDEAVFGKPAYSYAEDEERIRTVFFNAKSEDFPPNGNLPNAMRECELRVHASEYDQYSKHVVQLFPINDYFYD